MKNKIVIVTLIFAGLSVHAQQKPTLDELKRESDPMVLRKKLAILGAGNEQDKKQLMVYFQTKNDTKRADSVIQVLVDEFPKGEAAYIQLMKKMMAEDDVNKSEELVARIVRDFPNADMDRIHHSLAYGYASAKNIPKTKEHLNALSKRAKTGGTVVVARLLANYNVAEAEVLIHNQIEEAEKNGIPAKKAGGPRAQDDIRSSYFGLLEMYTNILLKQKRYAEALKYAKGAFEEYGSLKDNLISNYGLSLSKTGNHKEAIAVLEKLIVEGKGSGEAIAAFKESYAKVNSVKDADLYFAELQKAMKGKIDAAVAKMLINEAAPEFSITDAAGKVVTLADFKGKTIILDFWATWCGPCIKSFPAMQMVVNKYKADANVKILFIHTLERVKDPLADARNFLQSNNYKFDLYMDIRDAKTKASPAVNAFGAKGIPAKFVIDGNGRIRFKIVGFSEGDDAAVTELSTMIDLAKKEA